MNIPNLDVRTWCEILYEFYNTILLKLPNPKITSPDGKYTYTLRKPDYMAGRCFGIDIKVIKNYDILSEVERFCLRHLLIVPRYEKNSYHKYLNSYDNLSKEFVVISLAKYISHYQHKDIESDDHLRHSIFLLLQYNIFEGISETNLNHWLNESDSFISVADTKILVENMKKFFSQYLA